MTGRTDVGLGNVRVDERPLGGVVLELREGREGTLKVDQLRKAQRQSVHRPSASIHWTKTPREPRKQEKD